MKKSVPPSPSSHAILRPIADTVSGFKAAAAPMETIGHYEALAKRLWMPPHLETFGNRHLQSVADGQTVWGSISAPYGFGKTAAAICLWQQARHNGFLAIPPLSCTSFDELAAAIDAIASVQQPSLRPALRRLRAATWHDELDHMARADSNSYGIPHKTLRRLFRDKAEHGRLAFAGDSHRFVEFLSQISKLAEPKCKGVIVIIDELQQLLGPLDLRAVNRFREFVWGMRTERAKCGIMLALDTLLEARLARWAEDILHRIREAGLTMKLADIYTEEFPQWLWSKLTSRNGSTRPEVDRNALTEEVLLSLGQLVERPDLANGPRTVIDVFQRALDHFVAKKSAYQISNLTDDVHAGRFRYLGEGYPIQRELTRLLSDEWIAKDGARRSIVKILGAFPRGCPDRVLRRCIGKTPRLEKTIAGLFPSVLVKLSGGWALEALQQVRRPVTNWEQIIQQCWERLPALDALTAHIPDFVFRILIPRLFPGGNPNDPQWELVSDESVVALTGWRRYRGSFDADFPKRDVALYIGEKQPSCWPEDSSLAFAMICESDTKSDALPSAVVVNAGRIHLRLPVFRPLEDAVPAELSRYRKFIQPEPFRPAIVLAALHELKSFVDTREQGHDARLAPEGSGGLTQIETFAVTATDFLLSELFEGSVNTGIGKPLTLRGSEILRALFSKSCRERFPNYRTLVRTPRWREVLSVYRKALTSPDLSLDSRQGREQITGSKAEVYERLFAQKSTAAGDSLVRALGPLIKTSGDSKAFAVCFTLHPAERLLLHYLRQVPRKDDVPTSAATEFLRYQGYIEEEAAAIIDLLIARQAITVRKHTVTLSRDDASSREWVLERVIALRRDLSALGIKDDLIGVEDNRTEARQVLVNLEQQLSQRMAEVAEEIQAAGDEMARLIGVVVASSVPKEWVRSDLSAQLRGVSLLLLRTRDDLLRMARTERSHIQTEIVRMSDRTAQAAIPVYHRWIRLQNSTEKLLRRTEEFQQRIKAVCKWEAPNSQLRATRDLTLKISATDPGANQMLDELVGEFRERFAVDEWEPIFASTEFSERLRNTQAEVQTLLFQQAQVFYRERSALLKEYQNILPLGAPDFIDSVNASRRGDLASRSYQRLYKWACTELETALEKYRKRYAAKATWKDPRSGRRSWKELNSKATELLRQARQRPDYGQVSSAAAAVKRIFDGFYVPQGAVIHYDNPQRPPDFGILEELFVNGAIEIRIERKPK